MIFDTKYHEKFNFVDFMKPNQEKSFVEVVLWQSDENTLTDYSWVSQTKLLINLSFISSFNSYARIDCASSEILKARRRLLSTAKKSV